MWQNRGNIRHIHIQALLAAHASIIVEYASSRVFYFIPFLSSKKLVIASQTLSLSRTATTKRRSCSKAGSPKASFCKTLPTQVLIKCFSTSSPKRLPPPVHPNPMNRTRTTNRNIKRKLERRRKARTGERYS
ncbi:hypothetical protein ACFX12_011398 [Malus domestica]